MSYISNTKSVVPALWNIIREEEPLNNRDNSIIDEEEAWLLENAPALLLLEKASNVAQMALRKKSPDKIIMDLYKKVIELKTNDGNPQIPEIADSPDPEFRIIKFNFDFEHDGQLSGHQTIRDQAGYDTNIEKLKRELAKDMTQNVNKFILLLSLNFGGESGGHFAAVIGTPNGIYIFDPYYHYYESFKVIVEDAFGTTKPVQSFLSFAVEEAVHPDMSDPNVAAVIQSREGQDHFCWGWCILSFHCFMISKCSIDATREFFTDYFTAPERRIYRIKAYVYFLVSTGLLPVGEKFSHYFMNVFNHVWDEGKLYKIIFSPDMGIRMSAPKRKQSQPKAYKLSQLFANSPVSPLNLIEFYDNITEYEVNTTGVLMLNTPTVTIQLINDDTVKNEIIALIPTPPPEPVDTTNNIFYIAAVYYGVFNKAAGAGTVDPDATNYIVSDKEQLPVLDCNSPERVRDEKFYNLSAYASPATPKGACPRYQSLVKARNDKRDEVEQSPTCARTIIPVYTYQSRVVEVLVEKVRNAINATRIPGLLVWYGTGTGKTISAGIAAKFLVYCDGLGDVFDMCYVISPKSAYSNFEKELKLEHIFTDQINPGNSEADVYYRAGKLKVFSHSNFQNYVQKNNIDFSRSLIIIDEAHNFISSDGKADAATAAFMLDTCSKMKQVVLLTATPMRNEPYDLQFLMGMIDGTTSAAFMDKSAFYNTYIPNYKEAKRGLEINAQNICIDLPTQPVVNLTVNSQLPDFIRNFGDKIIKYERASEKMPNYKDAVSCVNLDASILPPDFEAALRTPMSVQRRMNTQSTSNSFGSLENRIIWSMQPNNPKLEQVYNIIKNREEAVEDALSSSGNKTYTFDPSNIRYKYIIFSQKTQNLDVVREFLVSRGINRDIIGTIDGSTAGRKAVAQRYNDGYTRIMLISPAAEEGVDFKRVSTIILLQPTYTWAEYLQIRGRGVRTNAHAQAAPGTPDAAVGRVAKVVECITSVVYFSTTRPTPRGDQTIFSTEVRNFIGMYKKRFLLDEFEAKIQPLFISNPAPPGESILTF